MGSGPSKREKEEQFITFADPFKTKQAHNLLKVSLNLHIDLVNIIFNYFGEICYSECAVFSDMHNILMSMLHNYYSKSEEEGTKFLMQIQHYYMITASKLEKKSYYNTIYRMITTRTYTYTNCKIDARVSFKDDKKIWDPLEPTPLIIKLIELNPKFINYMSDSDKIYHMCNSYADNRDMALRHCDINEPRFKRLRARYFSDFLNYESQQTFELCEIAVRQNPNAVQRIHFDKITLDYSSEKYGIRTKQEFMDALIQFSKLTISDYRYKNKPLLVVRRL